MSALKAVAWGALAFGLSVAALGCAAEPERDMVQVRIRSDAQLLSAGAIVYEPSDAVRSARVGTSGWLTIERQARARALTVRVPGFCPLRIAGGPQPAELALVPVIDLGGDRPPLGFDAPFAVRVEHGCPERGRGQISWRQIAGAPLRELNISQDGFSLSARTPSLEQLHPEPLPDGVVPFSPRSQGRAVLEATWRGPGDAASVRTISVPATSRSSGLSSVAVSQQLVLSDASYRVKSAPQAGHARPLPSGPVALFTPDAPGRWLLERDDGRALTLQALWHDKTPYDCGRAECHAQIAVDTAASPMSGALARPLSGSDVSSAAIGCRLDCHVLGERGLNDGGFLDVAHELGFVWLDGSRWQDLPQALRRLGGVRCTACHGPGAIPEPDARAAIVRVDVCATCHDAPPRYVHVQAWRASRMARSDAEPSTRQGACASCHTTSGFLAGLGARAGHAPQLTAQSEGIACAACHAPHASHRGARLLRSVPASSAALAADASAAAAPSDAVSALCIRCHAPTPGSLQPSASAAALYTGRVSIPATEGTGWETVRGPAAHGALPQACIACHGGRALAPRGPLDHSFRVDMRTCAPCHQGDAAESMRGAQRELQAWAERLARSLEVDCGPAAESVRAQPPHASEHSAQCAEQRSRRALYEVRLVLEDPAAAVHNAGFARALLRDAEGQLSGRATP